MAGALRCPVCNIALRAEQTNCPRCGLRVAPLPRRRRAAPAVEARPARPPVGNGVAARRGLCAGVLIVGACLLAALVAALAGGDGSAVLGDGLLASSAGLLFVAVLLGGVHIGRWTYYERLRERAEGGGGYSSVALRIGLGAAGAVPFAVFVVLAIVDTAH